MNDLSKMRDAATNLVSSAVWTPVTPAPVVITTNNVATNSISGARKFYRLNSVD